MGQCLPAFLPQLVKLHQTPAVEHSGTVSSRECEAHWERFTGPWCVWASLCRIRRKNRWRWKRSAGVPVVPFSHSRIKCAAGFVPFILPPSAPPWVWVLTRLICSAVQFRKWLSFHIQYQSPSLVCTICFLCKQSQGWSGEDEHTCTRTHTDTDTHGHRQHTHTHARISCFVGISLT